MFLLLLMVSELKIISTLITICQYVFGWISSWLLWQIAQIKRNYKESQLLIDVWFRYYHGYKFVTNCFWWKVTQLWNWQYTQLFRVELGVWPSVFLYILRVEWRKCLCLWSTVAQTQLFEKRGRFLHQLSGFRLYFIVVLLYSLCNKP